MIVTETVIVDVHLNGNDTVDVIRPGEGRPVNHRIPVAITSTVEFTCTCTATLTGPITITYTTMTTSTTADSPMASSIGGRRVVHVKVQGSVQVHVQVKVNAH